MSRAGATPAVVSLTLAEQLRGNVRVGTLSAAPVAVAAAAADLEREIECQASTLRERYSGRAPADVGDLAAARELYRAFGIDPTKTRPSSEKLLRRVLRELPLPRISNAVDLANLVALRLLLPVGLYDAAKIEGRVELRPGREGEGYTGTAGQQVHLAGRPLLTDQRGPFGNPTADSLRTAVEPATRALWLTVFAPASLPSVSLETGLRAAAAAFTRHLSGPGGPVIVTTGIVD